MPLIAAQPVIVIVKNAKKARRGIEKRFIKNGLVIKKYFRVKLFFSFYMQFSFIYRMRSINEFFFPGVTLDNFIYFLITCNACCVKSSLSFNLLPVNSSAAISSFNFKFWKRKKFLNHYFFSQL